MILAFLALSNSAVAAARCPPANETQVRDEFRRWMRAYEAHDLAGSMAIFSPDVRFEFQGSAEQDWKQLEEGYARSFARTGKATWVPTWDQVLVSGNLATAFSTWRGVVTLPGTKPEVRAENRGVDVLRRGLDCRWRIVHSLNFPLKAPSPAATK
jgi:uncharacterized protein (TIGR02246 family)